jgi:hypothetical protein
MVRLWITLFAAATLVAGCGIMPNSKSGGDGKRSVASEIPLDDWVTDDVNYKKGDQSDWKKIMIDRPGTLHVQIAIDNADAEIWAILYDKYGNRLSERFKRQGDTEQMVMKGQVGQGKHFIQIRAKTSSDHSEYSIRASMIGTSGFGNIERPE